MDSNRVSIFICGNGNINYNITYENNKFNFEKIALLIQDFLNSKNIKIDDISGFYVNRGPGSFAGIRNTLSTIKAIHLVKKINYYCFSFDDFKGIKNIKYENIPNLCDKFKIKKNLINPIYIS